MYVFIYVCDVFDYFPLSQQRAQRASPTASAAAPPSRAHSGQAPQPLGGTHGLSRNAPFPTQKPEM